MGSETEKLMDTCTKAMLGIVEWTKSNPNALKSMKAAIQRLEGSNARGNRESAVTERTFLKNSVNMIGIYLTRLETGAKALEKKVASKKVLDFFKTQQSLGEAKKVLADSKAALVEGKKELAKAEAEYAAADKRVTELLDRLDPPAGFEVCLKSGPYAKPFAEFVKSRHVEENLEFLLLFRGGKMTASNAPKIYAGYIKTGSPKQINIDDPLRTQFDDCSASGDWSGAPFKKAAEVTYNLLEQGVYPGFLQSKYFK
jgi:hypothetical protein